MAVTKKLNSMNDSKQLGHTVMDDNSLQKNFDEQISDLKSRMQTFVQTAANPRQDGQAQEQGSTNHQIKNLIDQVNKQKQEMLDLRAQSS